MISKKRSSRYLFTGMRLSICIIAASITAYAYIHKQNELTEMRRSIPRLQKELRHIQGDNIHLQYEVERFESPIHLMEIARKPEFSHLKYPYVNEIVIIPSALTSRKVHFEKPEGGSHE